MTARIWLVRHGNTFDVDEPVRRIGSLTDLPLKPSGQEQALKLASYFKRNGISFRYAYAGPLSRAWETAEIIMTEQDCPLKPMLALQEIDHGPDEGATESSVLDRIGKEALARWDLYGEAPDGWKVDAAKRFESWRSFFDEVVSANSGNYLCVSSNGALRFALLFLDKNWNVKIPKNLRMRTGAIGVISISDGMASVDLWNKLPD